MILVTTGTHPQGFERLVKAADELATVLDEPVIIQRGSSRYMPEHAEHFEWASGHEMEQLTGQARVVVAHAAAGAILLALRLKKPLVIVPRLKRYGEVLDDHQLELSVALSESGRAIVVQEPSMSALRDATAQAKLQTEESSAGSQLIQALRLQLAQWDKNVGIGSKS